MPNPETFNFLWDTEIAGNSGKVINPLDFKEILPLFFIINHMLPISLINPLEPTRTLNYMEYHFGYVYISWCNYCPHNPIFDFFLLLNR
jgi:hypothetical protein